MDVGTDVDVGVLVLSATISVMQVVVEWLIELFGGWWLVVGREEASWI